MDALFITLWMIFLLGVCGLGPTLLLLRRDECTSRILVSPCVGLCSIVILSMALAPLGLNGGTIAKLDIIILGILAAVSLRFSPPGVDEFKRAFLPLLIACGALALIGWPLFSEGARNYIGYGNPDVPTLLRQAMYMETHPFGLAGGQNFAGYAYGVRPDLVLGVSYVMLMTAATAGFPVWALFSTCCAVMVALAPLSVWALCTDGLGAGRRVAWVAAVAMACSAQLANTFYLHSLGTLSVMAIGPLALTAALRVADGAGWRTAALLGVVCAGLWYNYYPGAAFVGVLVAFVILGALVCGRIKLMHAVRAAGLAGAAMFLTFLPFATNVVRSLAHETTGRVLLIKVDEIQTVFALTLTERVIPFLWGLLPLLSEGGAGSAVNLSAGLVAGTIFTLVAAFCVFVAPWRSRWAFGFALGGYTTVFLAYTIRLVGYGVFKLAAWGNPLILVALAGATVGLGVRLAARSRALIAVPVAIMAALLVCNVQLTLNLGMASVSTGRINSMHNLPGYHLSDFQALQGATSGRGRITSALQDPVLNHWVTLFVPRSQLGLLSTRAFDLTVTDSRPMSDADIASIDPVTSSLILYRTDSATGRQRLSVTQNRVFGLATPAAYRDQLVYGAGWYRAEGFENRLFWQRHFRWLRKRAELLLVNPSHDTYSLAVTAVAGYGHSSAQRTVTLYVNGRPFDEFTVSGYARVASRPFQTLGRITQIELEVRERAGPLPRRVALWNKWVPQEARNLNIAIADAHLLEASAGEPVPERADFRLPESFGKGLMNGIYPDRWMAREAIIELRMPKNARAMEIRGLLPAGVSLPTPYTLGVELGGKSLGSIQIDRPGQFSASVGIPEKLMAALSGSRVTVKLSGVSTFTNKANGDPRPLTVQLDLIGFVPAQAARLRTANPPRTGDRVVGGRIGSISSDGRTCPITEPVGNPARGLKGDRS